MFGGFASTKAIWCSRAARLFQVEQRVATLNRARGRQTSYQAVRRHRSIYRDQLLKHANLGIDYRVVPPRMSYYMQKSAAIYDIYLRFIKPEHIHVYSIDVLYTTCKQLKLFTSSIFILLNVI